MSTVSRTALYPSRLLAASLLALAAACEPDPASLADDPGADEAASEPATRTPYAATGGVGQACKPDGACNAGLVCGKNKTCVDPEAESGRWFAAFAGTSTGGADYNRCAHDVKQQFDDAWDGAMRWDSASWSFNWETNYAPSGREPDNVFEEHVQGFARTNRDPYRFVGSYSDESGGNGGVFFVHRDAEGHKKLKYLYSSRHAHPSGVSVLGRFVMFSDRADHVRLIDMNDLGEDQLIEFKASGMSRAGGGLGMAKLAGDGYLLVVSPKGSSEGNDREVRFYHLHGSLTAPKVTPVGTWAYTQPSSWKGDYRYTENLTVIPECGTGDIYVVNTTGDNRLLGDGYFLLSKVVQKKGQGLALQPLRAYHMDQRQSDCHLRSAATAWIDGSGDLQLLCSERAAVNGVFDGNADNLRFRHGYNYKN